MSENRNSLNIDLAEEFKKYPKRYPYIQIGNKRYYVLKIESNKIEALFHNMGILKKVDLDMNIEYLIIGSVSQKFIQRKYQELNNSFLNKRSDSE